MTSKNFEHNRVVSTNGRQVPRLLSNSQINHAGVGVVLELLDRIDSMEREIAQLRKQTLKDR